MATVDRPKDGDYDGQAEGQANNELLTIINNQYSISFGSGKFR
jgi:hypothetical protein